MAPSPAAGKRQHLVDRKTAAPQICRRRRPPAPAPPRTADRPRAGGQICIFGEFHNRAFSAFRAGRTRRYALYAVLAITFCLAALADLPDTARLLFYLGGALTLFGFLFQRSAVLAAPWDNI